MAFYDYWRGAISLCKTIFDEESQLVRQQGFFQKFMDWKRFVNICNGVGVVMGVGIRFRAIVFAMSGSKGNRTSKQEHITKEIKQMLAPNKGKLKERNTPEAIPAVASDNRIRYVELMMRSVCS